MQTHDQLVKKLMRRSGVRADVERIEREDVAPLDTSLQEQLEMPKASAKLSAKTKTLRYDVTEQPRTPEEMAAYLDAWLAEAPEGAAGIARALGDIARAKGMSQVARDAGLSRESLYKALGDNGNPSFATVLKVARELGVRLHVETV